MLLQQETNGDAPIFLDIKNLGSVAKNHCLAQYISDSAWSNFVTKLEFKAAWFGKTILRIGQFEPSSKLCNVCGYYNSDLTLKDISGNVLIVKQNMIGTSIL